MALIPVPLHAENWLLENGPKELESLLRAVVYHPSASLLITDNDRRYSDASSGAGRLLGLSRDEIIGRTLDDFVEPAFKPQMSELWKAFLQQGHHKGRLQVIHPDGSRRQVDYSVRGNILPARHILVMRESPEKVAGQSPVAEIPAWVQDYALFLLSVDATVAAWYAGAERMYGYTRDEVLGQPLTLLYPAGDPPDPLIRHELKRSVEEGHFGNEGWGMRKNGERFWANAITMALRDENGVLQGYARVVRDFTERHEMDEELQRTRARLRPAPSETLIAGVVSGEFDRIPEANDVFLDMVGYTREDLQCGRLRWPDLTPPEYIALDELAHEQGLRFGACTPFTKELIRKDGTRIPVLVATAVLKLSPFRWISFIQDLRGARRQEDVETGVAETGVAETGVAEVEENHFEEIIGRSASLKRLLEQVEVVAPTNATVLILGETGTGKELVARAIHRLSPRRDLPFISLNCAAIPTGLLESELFGYEKGAFTGALSQKIGRFEMANRGTLFLDEVGDIPMDLQPKLLRALQEKSFERLGGTRTIPIEVRLVAATNRNLTQMMGDKLFRSDLYYRLKVFPVNTPPLRNHPEDIPLLAWHFVKKYGAEMNRKIERISPQTLKALANWSWPGNVREFENFIERSVILSKGAELNAPLAELGADAQDANVDSTLEEVEKAHIIRVLRDTGGVVSRAAARLGMPRTTLNALIRRLGISSDEF
jgi:formate hydrogenlyase transcriptional activator